MAAGDSAFIAGADLALGESISASAVGLRDSLLMGVDVEGRGGRIIKDCPDLAGFSCCLEVVSTSECCICLKASLTKTRAWVVSAISTTLLYH